MEPTKSDEKLDRRITNKRNLSPKEERFVREYASTLNAVQAFIRAGFSSEGNIEAKAWKLLKRPHVARAVRRQKKIVSSLIGAADWQVIRELQIIAMADATLLKVNPETGEIEAPRDQPEMTRAISSIKRARTERNGKVVHTAEIKCWDKAQALKMIGDHLDMFDAKGKENDRPAVLVISGVDAQAALGLRPPEVKRLSGPDDVVDAEFREKKPARGDAEREAPGGEA